MDWLSVAVGSIHGAISAAARREKKVEARLNIEHLETLRQATGVPLVLHGGTGIRKEYVMQRPLPNCCPAAAEPSKPPRPPR